MPMYHVSVPPGLLTESQRQDFSQAVVDVHCGITGAPPSFVHALFTDSAEPMPGELTAIITGTIRAGRTDVQKNEITSRLTASLAAIAGVEPEAVQATVHDIDASYTMEGGVLLPEPGSAEEKAWMA